MGGKAAAYRTEGSQPNTMEVKKLFQIIAGNTKTHKKSVSPHLMEPQSWDAMATVIQTPRCCVDTACQSRHVGHRNILIIMSAVCSCKKIGITIPKKSTLYILQQQKVLQRFFFSGMAY